MRHLQRHLEQLYAIEVAHLIDDFLITDRATARLLENRTDARQAPEKLLIAQDGENIDLALYVDSSVVDHLQRNDPTSRLHHGNLEQFLIALEGVSHFLYLTWNAGRERSVTLLELEMQAEVDKFVIAQQLLRHQGWGGSSIPLRWLLFEYVGFDEALTVEELERYRHANHYAGKFCWQLESRFATAPMSVGMLTELRRFYRMSQREKIRRIDNG